MWGGQYWPQSVQFVGGLPVLGMVHTLGAWLFAAFVTMHVYLTATGHTPLSNIKAMITGCEDLPDGEGRAGGVTPSQQGELKGAQS